MATLLLDRSDLALRLDGEALAIYEPAGRRGTVPVKLLERVIIQGSIAFDAGILTKLAEAGIPTIFLSKRHSRRTAIVLGPAHNDAAIRLAQSRRVFDESWCGAWARRQIRAKTRAQIRLLRHALVERPDQRHALATALQSLGTIDAELAAKDAAAARVRGLEGAAARAYFQGLSALFPPSLGFTGRNRRPPRDPVNACLSLGYTLLHFEAVRACHAAGLDPLLGFYHRPSFGRESLASDLIEPLRPHIDRRVWELFRSRELRDDHFGRDGAACLLGKMGRATFYTDYEAHVAPVRRLLMRQSRLIARQLKRQGEPWLDHEDDDENGI